jgi:hypothetical protein
MYTDNFDDPPKNTLKFTPLNMLDGYLLGVAENGLIQDGKLDPMDLIQTVNDRNRILINTFME